MKRISLLLCWWALVAANAATADVYRCTVGRQVPVYANIACGPDAVRLDLPGIPIMIRDPSAAVPERRGNTRTKAPRGPATAQVGDAAQIQAWAKASRDRLPPSLNGKGATPKSPVRDRVNRTTPTEDACSGARAALTKAEESAWESGKRLSFAESRRLNDVIFDACY